MPPSSSSDYRGDTPSVDGFKLSLRNAINKIQASNIYGILFGNPGGMVIRSAHCLFVVKVTNILKRRNPLQIFGAVVCLISVFVIYLGEPARIRNERLGHQSVNRARFALVSPTQRHPEILFDANMSGFFLPAISMKGFHRSVFPNSIPSIVTIDEMCKHDPIIIACTYVSTTHCLGLNGKFRVTH